MSPEEKAIELVYKFYDEIKYMERAKICALISVDEILKVVSFYNDTQAEIAYWQEVKKKIEKL